MVGVAMIDPTQAEIQWHFHQAAISDQLSTASRDRATALIERNRARLARQSAARLIALWGLQLPLPLPVPRVHRQASTETSKP